VGNVQFPRRPFNVEDDHAAELVETPSRHGVGKTLFALVTDQDFAERGDDRRNRTEGQIAGGEAVLSGAETLFLAQNLVKELTADAAQLTHKSSGHGEAAEA
jgi:hypothetical protein